jgi:hypothetical protein
MLGLLLVFVMVVADAVGNRSLAAAAFPLAFLSSRGAVVDVVFFVFLSLVHI